MITNQSVNVTSLAEPVAAINKSHQQLPPQRSLRARSSLKTLVQTSLPPEQQSNTHNDHDPHHKISSNINTNEKDNKSVTPEERRGSALVSEIMRRLSRAQPALPTHDIHIHDTSNLSEDNEIIENGTTNTGQVKKKSLSDLPILRIPVPPSILKTSSESIPHKVEGRKIQFIDPILSNSSSEVDSMSNASSSLLEQTPDKRLGVNHPSDFIVSSVNNNNNDNREDIHSLEQMNSYYHESTPLKENEVIDNNVTQNNDVPMITNSNDVNKNIITAKSSTSPSSVSSSSSIVSSPAFGSLESTPHQHNIPQVQSSLPSLAQVHPLMETNRPRDNKELARVSQQASNTNHTQSVPKEVHRAAPLPARPRMSREPAKTNKSNSNIVVTKVEKSKSSPRKEGSENDKSNNNHDTSSVKNVSNNDSSNSDSQNVDYSNSAEDHFSIPPFRHEPHTSASNTLQTSEQSELTKAELIRQLQKYEEEVRQNAERSLRLSGQSVSQTQNVKPAETVQVNGNTQANNKTLTDSKAEHEPRVNSKQLGTKNHSENKNDNSQELEEQQQEQTDIVEVPLIDTSLSPEIEYELPHVPSVNQTNRQETTKIRTAAQKQLPKENTLLSNKKSNKNDASNFANYVNNEQTEAQRRKSLEQVYQNVSVEQPESVDSKVENAYDGNDITQNMLYLLLYNELAGSKNKHSLEYLMNRWEKRQKRDLAKRMQEVLGIDTDLREHQTKKKKGKHQKHHKSQGSVKREHHHTKERSGSRKRKDTDKHKRHQSHKHKHASPHKHKHKHHHHKDDNSSNHEKHQDEIKVNKEVQWERHKEKEEDHNNKENTENKPDYPTTAVLNDFAHEDSEPNNNTNNNAVNVKKNSAELSGNEEHHVDYKTLSLEELKAAARRYGLEFAEKTQN